MVIGVRAIDMDSTENEVALGMHVGLFAMIG